MKLRKQLHSQQHQKIFRNKFNKRGAELFTGNYTTLSIKRQCPETGLSDGYITL